LPPKVERPPPLVGGHHQPPAPVKGGASESPAVSPRRKPPSICAPVIPREEGQPQLPPVGWREKDPPKKKNLGESVPKTAIPPKTMSLLFGGRRKFPGMLKPGRSVNTWVFWEIGAPF